LEPWVVVLGIGMVVGMEKLSGEWEEEWENATVSVRVRE